MITLSDLHTRAALPPTHVVCGMRLVPLTVGHARLLTALGLWAPEDPAQLILAAALCSDSSDAFRRAFESRLFRLKLQLWAWRLGTEYDYKRAGQCWADYITTHTDQPVAICKGKPRAAAMPMHAILKVRLCQDLGYDPQTFDSVPYAQALLDYWALSEAADSATIKDYSVRSLQTALRN